MSRADSVHYWTVWYPKAAATGLLIARGMIDATDQILFHAAPKYLSVEVTDRQGNRIAYGKNLEQSEDSPMCRLRREGDRVAREDLWPTEADLGTVVLLPGGEAGVLKEWWNADDRKEWRWQVEFYNTIRDDS